MRGCRPRRAMEIRATLAKLGAHMMETRVEPDLRGGWEKHGKTSLILMVLSRPIYSINRTILSTSSL